MRGRQTGLKTASAATDEDRFAALYETHYAAIHSYCSRRTGRDRVDDAIAETFLVAWKRIADVPAGHEALLWLYRVAYRVVGHDWRSDVRRRRLTERVGSVRQVAARTPEDRAISDDDCDRMLDALATLKPDEAEILRLVAWEGLAAGELAGMLDVRPNTASQRLSRARKHLAQAFDGLESDPVRSPAAQQGGV